MANVRSRGLISVKFPPPIPDGLGRNLRWKVRDLLGGAGECDASATDAPSEAMQGWALGIYLKKGADVQAWVDRLVPFFQGKKVPVATVLHSSVRRGPVVLPIDKPADALATLLRIHAKDSRRAWADVFVETSGRAADFSAIFPKIWETLPPHGKVINDYITLKDPSLHVVVDEVGSLDNCMRDLCKAMAAHLKPEAATVEVYTETEPQLTSVYPAT